jgi:hypothetical protein
MRLNYILTPNEGEARERDRINRGSRMPEDWGNDNRMSHDLASDWHYKAHRLQERRRLKIKHLLV